MKPDYEIDLRGVECPLNFVKTKIKLDDMKPNQTLEVLLDPGESFESVKNSVLEEGHQVLEQVQVKDYFKVTIKKC